MCLSRYIKFCRWDVEENISHDLSWGSVMSDTRVIIATRVNDMNGEEGEEEEEREDDDDAWDTKCLHFFTDPFFHSTGDDVSVNVLWCDWHIDTFIVYRCVVRWVCLTKLTWLKLSCLSEMNQLTVTVDLLISSMRILRKSVCHTWQEIIADAKLYLSCCCYTTTVDLLLLYEDEYRCDDNDDCCWDTYSPS